MFIIKYYIFLWYRRLNIINKLSLILLFVIEVRNVVRGMIKYSEFIFMRLHIFLLLFLVRCLIFILIIINFRIISEIYTIIKTLPILRGNIFLRF